MKKGQTEVSLGTILLVILGIIGLVVVGMFIYNAYGRGGEIIGGLPGGFDIAVASCDYAAGLGNKGTFCGSFKELKVGGKTQYANCEYLELEWAAEINKPEGKAWKCNATEWVKNETDSSKLDLTQSDSYAINYCTQLKNSQEDFKNSTVVNGLPCGGDDDEGKSWRINA